MPLPVLPQPATETTARAPNRGACAICTRKLLPFSHGFWQAAALLRTPGSCALGDFIGIGWKGTRIPGNEMLLAMKKAAI